MPFLSIKLLSTSWSNTMHLYSPAKFRHVSVSATTTIIRADSATDQKHRCRRCLSCHIHIAIFGVPHATQWWLCHTSHVWPEVVGYTVGSGGSVRGCIRLHLTIDCVDLLGAFFLRKLPIRLVLLRSSPKIVESPCAQDDNETYMLVQTYAPSNGTSRLDGTVHHTNS